MHPIRRILIAVKDPDLKSLPAVAKGAQLAHSLGAEIELFHGIAVPVAAEAYVYTNGGMRDYQRKTRARYLERLEAIAARLRGEGLKVKVGAVWDYPVYESIVRRALRSKADLIVAECHAGRRLTPWMLHLTDWELLRTSPVPVLLVKNKRPYRRPVVLAALDPSHAFAKPAKLDAEILKAGSLIASGLRGSLHVMHAYVPLPIGALPVAGTSAAVVTQLEATAESQATRAFEGALKSTKIARPRRHLVPRPAIDAIPATARKVHSSIVVMGAISRSGLKRVFIGNTAERVLRDLACDVLVVKPARFAAKVSRTSRGVHYVATPRLAMPF